MARPDEFEATALTLPHTPPLTLTAEYAIRTRRTGRIRAEWGALTPDQIRDVIDSTPSTRERYELVVRYVTAWEVAE